MSAPAPMTDAEAVAIVHELGIRLARFEPYINAKGEQKKQAVGNDAKDLRGCSLEEAQRWVSEGGWVGVLPADANCIVLDVDEGGKELQDRVIEWRASMLTYPTRAPDEHRYHNWYPAEPEVAREKKFSFGNGDGEVLRGTQWCIPRDWPGLANALLALRDATPGAKTYELLTEEEVSFWKDKAPAERRGGRARRKPVRVRNREAALRALLKNIDGVWPVDNHDAWLKVGQALRLEYADERQGWEVFDRWSRGGDGPVPPSYDRKRNRARWRSFRTEGERLVTFASVLRMAEKHDPEFRREYEAGELSELAVAERLVSSWEKQYVFVTDDTGKSGNWARWIGHVFVERDAKSYVQRAVRELQHDIKAGGGPKRELGATQSHRFANAAKAYAQEMRQCPRSFFDNKTDALNTPDGVLDLTAFEVTPHEAPAPYLKSTAVAPGAAGDCPVWQNCMEAWQPDPEVRAFLQRVAGYSLLADNREHALIILIGEGGNGKGTFIETLMAVLGDYAALIDKSAFLGRQNSDPHPTALADLHGVRLAVVSEVEHESTWNESALKHATGDRQMKARRMHQDFFTFDVQALPVIVANHAPQLRHTDDAMRRRLHLVPFDVTFKDEPKQGERKANTLLPDRLEAEHPAILAWMLDGLRSYQEQGLSPPEAVTSRGEDYFSNQDTVAQFIRQACWLEKDGVTRAHALYQHYVEWSNVEGHKPLGSRRFGEEMTSKQRRTMGIERDELTRGRIYRGIQIHAPVSLVGHPLVKELEADGRATTPAGHDGGF